MPRAKQTPNSVTVNAANVDFVEKIHDFMDEHVWLVDDALVEETGEAAKKAAAELRERSRKLSGAYAKGWIAEVQATETGVEGIVHNKKWYMMTHLLEKGHIVKNRANGPALGRASGDGLIAKVADEVGSEFEGKFQE